MGLGYGKDCVKEHTCTGPSIQQHTFIKKIRDLGENNLNLFPKDLVRQQIVHQNIPIFHSAVVY